MRRPDVNPWHRIRRPAKFCWALRQVADWVPCGAVPFFAIAVLAKAEGRPYRREALLGARALRQLYAKQGVQMHLPFPVVTPRTVGPINERAEAGADTPARSQAA